MLSHLCQVNYRKHILIAPLNWGLGHATRCIPIIRSLVSENYKVTIASDGQALDLLKKEFPSVPFIKLPSYRITYAIKSADFKKKMLRNIPQILRAIKEERKKLNSLIESLEIDAVISDNRLGMYTSKVPAILISHQLNVLSGRTTWFTTWIHRFYIQKFDECWVPDILGDTNLSGVLGHPKKPLNIPTKYIGILSRMESATVPYKYKVIAVLSGPEPQRSLLRELLYSELRKLPGKALLVEGVISRSQESSVKGNVTIINYLTSTQLEKAINASEFVIARSGYTTVMDLARLQKKVFFIPTPGQPEQEYLAMRLKKLCIAPYSTQETFKIKDLAGLKVYKGFSTNYQSGNFSNFFSFFHCERKLRTNTKFALYINLFFMRFYNVFYDRQTQS
ncbi:uncharacterized protein (TIGR00661 family) [Dokdonia sp. Hel_I_53]|nr:uncharacterized protein (TIGR00661 family) [Dokdonia sp. Hel_I_53]